MSVIDYAMKLFGSVFTSNVTCPVCGLKSAQPSSKLRLKSPMLCPGCKALFNSPR